MHGEWGDRHHRPMGGDTSYRNADLTAQLVDCSRLAAPVDGFVLDPAEIWDPGI